MSKHFISLSQAVEMTKRFRNEADDLLVPAMKGKGILANCETFDRDAFDAILSQSGCKQIRFYSGLDNDKRLCMVAVGVDDNGNDMLPANNDDGKVDASANKILDTGMRCPTDCPPASVLNNN